ncbi:MAG: hypothetical protein EOO40_09235, partial [Deltaproteobacteria bacterium]
MSSDLLPSPLAPEQMLAAQRGVGKMLGASLAVHLLLLGGVWAAAQLAPALQPRPQQAIMTKLVRLG